MTREVAHQKSFEKALYSIEPNFPTGKLPGDPRFTDTYYDLSIGEGNAQGPWNQGDQWQYVSVTNMRVPVDEGDGMAATTMTKAEQAALLQLATRTKAALDRNPVTGAEAAEADRPHEPPSCTLPYPARCSTARRSPSAK